MSDTQRKHALVTGGSAGIGRAIVHALEREGWRVTIFDLRPPTGRAMDTTRWTPVDLREQRQVLMAVRQLGDDLPALLVNNAGIYKPDDLAQDEEYLRDIGSDNFTTQSIAERCLDTTAQAEIWQVNYAAARTLMLQLSDFLRRTELIVITVGSQAGYIGGQAGDYAASKAAIMALTRSFAEKGLRTAAIAPGLVSGTRLYEAIPPEVRTAFEERCPVPTCTPEDVAIHLIEQLAYLEGRREPAPPSIWTLE